MGIPVMLRQARKAVAHEDFVEAERLYALVLEDDEMKDMVDIQIRHAFCLEKLEDMTSAVNIYQNIVHVYQIQGETGAAKALELKISILNKFIQTEPELVETMQEELETARYHLDVMFEGNDTTNFEDIDLFGLDTQEVSLEQKTQHDAEADQHVILDLVAIEDKAHVMDGEQVSTIELHVEAQPEQMKEPAAEFDNGAESQVSKEVPVAKPVEKVSPEARDSRQQDDSLLEIQAMIKQGIHQNVTHKSDEEVEEISFTNIGDFTPQLPADVMQEQDNPSTVELDLQDKAGKLFGK